MHTYVSSLLSLLPPHQVIREHKAELPVLGSSFPLAICFVHAAAAAGCSVVSYSLQPHGLQAARFLCPWRFSRQEYWSGLPCPLPGDIPNPGIEPRFPTLQADSLLSEAPGKPVLHMVVYICQCYFLNLSHPLLPALCTHVCSLHLRLYSCSANRFICTYFHIAFISVLSV